MLKILTLFLTAKVLTEEFNLGELRRIREIMRMGETSKALPKYRIDSL